ncbi:hypothetical protein CANINC_000454 [Pichia inconspicua]|uniref:Glutamate decarboxylase n=1 Tax=Pichia inconspicua TaxID=52247 RepID=A0A4T0X7G5_9ASCO|nr:hypothetical protein CANINC_000454 [[Candida] inconspicua]
MPLSSQIDPDAIEDRIFQDSSLKADLIKKYFNKFSKNKNTPVKSQLSEESLVARFRGISNKYKLQDEITPSQIAYEMVHDDLKLDGSTTLNLASFVNVYTDDNAKKLILENFTKNLADCDEYPMMVEMQDRCISILADMWHAPLVVEDSGIETPHHTKNFAKYKTRAIGTPCTGSSEAIMLGGLAMKKNWQARRKAAGKSIENPNILMASCAQVALEKFATYFDVENRLIGVSEKDFLIDINKIKENLDENTIGIYVIVGSTYTGGFEDVEKIAKLLDEYEEETGIWIPIHVDGASGGFIAPIIYPDLKWDFRIDRVMSISTSGHKFGLVTAGLGWVLFRTQEWLPKELRFQLQYLGGMEESFSLNFSRSGYQVIHQYYNFIRFGREGYRQIFDNCLFNARLLSLFLEETGYFTCISNLHLPKGVSTRQREPTWSPETSHQNIAQHDYFNPALPVVSFQLTKDFINEYPEIPQSLISTMLRNKKWIIPNYQLPRINVPKVDQNGKEIDDESLLNEANGENNEILRVVVKYNLTAELLDKLMHDISDVIAVLVKSVKLVRESVKTMREGGEETDSETVYNMLLCISNDGDERLIRFKKAGSKSQARVLC